jgi:hypothetical protein
LLLLQPAEPYIVPSKLDPAKLVVVHKRIQNTTESLNQAIAIMLSYSLSRNAATCILSSSSKSKSFSSLSPSILPHPASPSPPSSSLLLCLLPIHPPLPYPLPSCSGPSPSFLPPLILFLLLLRLCRQSRFISYHIFLNLIGLHSFAYVFENKVVLYI